MHLDWQVANDSTSALGLHAALQEFVRYKRKQLAINGPFLCAFEQGHGQMFAISRN